MIVASGLKASLEVPEELFKHIKTVKHLKKY